MIKEKLQELATKELQCFPEIGIGYYPVIITDHTYNGEYWEKYQKYDNTTMGFELNNARMGLVRKYYNGDSILDVGIGGGLFVNKMDCLGTDINTCAIKWLTENNKLWNGKDFVDCMTFHDSLEHFHDPEEILSKVKKYVFISCPIYKNTDHILTSKHYRKDEHCWYWTHQGIITFMSWYGFEYLYSDKRETDLGRQDIGSFVFKKIKE